MTWHQFRYAFDKQVENAMRYSIEEAVREECMGACGLNRGRAVAQDAVERFKRKMEKLENE